MFDFLALILKYKFIILFYLAVIIFLFIKRKQLTVQSKIIFLYRTKWGLKWMDKYSQKYREWVIILGYIGMGAGYIGMMVISYVLIKNLYDLIINPATVSGVSLVLPGIKVPGMGILPFWHWLASIFIIALVHEFSHGIVARAHNLTVKNTGLVFFGPILGAFVEPDEKKLQKEPDIKQYSVLAAGSFSNILLALLALVLLNFLFMPLQNIMVTPTGFTFDSYVNESYPFAQAGIAAGTIITGINGKTSTDFIQFNDDFSCLKPGDKVILNTKDKDGKKEKDYSLILAASPDQPKKPFMGIKEIHNEFDIKEKYQAGIGKFAYTIISWLTQFFRWLFLLSFGIALFNLLPLPIVDGGRMVQVFLHKKKGPVDGEKRYRQIGLLFLLVLLLNLFYPLLAKLFF